MFSYNELTHPFNAYKKNKLELKENHYYLRVYQNLLWIVDAKNTDKGIRQSYNGHNVIELNMSTKELADFNSSLQANLILKKTREDKLINIKSPLSGAKRVDFKSHQAVTILPHEYATAYAISQQPILGTFGAGPCVILALYDYKNKIAVLAHVDSTTLIDSLKNILYPLSTKDTSAHLLGGDLSSQRICIEILEFFEHQDMKIVNADIVRDSPEPASLAIDARNGNIYSPVSHMQLSKSLDFEMRLKLCGLNNMESPLIEVKLSKTTASTDSANRFFTSKSIHKLTSNEKEAVVFSNPKLKSIRTQGDGGLL